MERKCGRGAIIQQTCPPPEAARGPGTRRTQKVPFNVLVTPPVVYVRV